MHGILEMHIPHSSVAAVDRDPLLAVLAERMEYLIGLLVSYDSPNRDNQRQILGVGAVLLLGLARLARLRLEAGFISICL